MFTSARRVPVPGARSVVGKRNDGSFRLVDQFGGQDPSGRHSSPMTSTRERDDCVVAAEAGSEQHALINFLKELADGSHIGTRTENITGVAPRIFSVGPARGRKKPHWRSAATPPAAITGPGRSRQTRKPVVKSAAAGWP